MVVSIALFVVPAKNFASVATFDIWCIQMTSATKLAATIFLE